MFKMLLAEKTDSYDFCAPVFYKMPEYFAKFGYQCPTATQGPAQYAWTTNLSCFDFLTEPQNAEKLKNGNLFMQGREQATASWLDFYPFQERVLDGLDSGSDSVAVIDVGGGLGHKLLELRERFPTMQGRLILQDLPKTVQQAGDPKGVFEAMPHNFFDQQPIKGMPRTHHRFIGLMDNLLGARAYYMKRVLPDWPDKECRIILKQLAAVMRRGYSKILLNEHIMLDDRISEFVNSLDLTMMALSGGRQFTKRQWDELVESAGLRIDKVWTLNEETESVLEVVLA